MFERLFVSIVILVSITQSFGSELDFSEFDDDNEIGDRDSKQCKYKFS